MPKAASLPSYRLHKPSGQARVIVRGRHVYLGPYDSPESREKYGRLIAELAVTPATAPPPTTTAPTTFLVVQLAAAYWQFAEGYYVRDGRPTDHTHMVRRALHYLKKLYANTPAQDFGPLKLQAVQEHLVGEKLSRSTINKLVEIIRRAFKWGVSKELLPAAVHQALATVAGLKRGRTAARETAPVLPVADAVVDATLPHLPAVVADMVQFERFTGCRPGEVCGLRPMDVDRTGDVWIYRPESHKTEHLGRTRIIYIGPQAQDVLRPYLLRAADAFCFSPAESVAKLAAEKRAKRRTRVQPAQFNRRKAKPKRAPADHYTKDSYGRALARGIEKANRQRAKEAAERGVEPVLLPHWHANQLRHSAATEIRRAFGLEAAQVVLGHAKADVTQVYAERDEALGRDVARKIG